MGVRCVIWVCGVYAYGCVVCMHLNLLCLHAHTYGHEIEFCKFASHRHTRMRAHTHTHTHIHTHAHFHEYAHSLTHTNRPPSSRIKRAAAAENSSESSWEVTGSGQDGVNKGTDGIGLVTSQERTEIMLPSVQNRSKPSSPTGERARRSGAARSPSPAHTSKSPTDRREGKEARKGIEIAPALTQ